MVTNYEKKYKLNWEFRTIFIFKGGKYEHECEKDHTFNNYEKFTYIWAYPLPQNDPPAFAPGD